jgi:hypothetical protein
MLYKRYRLPAQLLTATELYHTETQTLAAIDAPEDRILRWSLRSGWSGLSAVQHAGLVQEPGEGHARSLIKIPWQNALGVYLRQNLAL